MAWVEGPYGQVVHLEEYGCVLLFASGPGMFAMLPWIRHLTELVKTSSANTRRIKLIWHTEQYHDQVQHWMQSVLDDKELDRSVRHSPYLII